MYILSPLVHLHEQQRLPAYRRALHLFLRTFKLASLLQTSRRHILCRTRFLLGFRSVGLFFFEGKVNAHDAPDDSYAATSVATLMTAHSRDLNRFHRVEEFFCGFFVLLGLLLSPFVLLGLLLSPFVLLGLLRVPSFCWPSAMFMAAAAATSGSGSGSCLDPTTTLSPRATAREDKVFDKPPSPLAACIV